MQQDYPDGGLPFVGTHVIERVDLETGEKLPPSVNQKLLEGSYSTKLTIRCNGNRVRVEGNPSRWQRMDNLVGLTTLDECVEIYNNVLAKYDLPPFTKTPAYSTAKHQMENRHLLSVTALKSPSLTGLVIIQSGRERKPPLSEVCHLCKSAVAESQSFIQTA